MATWSRDEDGDYFVRVEEQDSDYQEETWTAGEDQIPIRGVEFDLKHRQSHRNYGVTFQRKIDLRWEIRRRDRRWDFRPEKVPGYQLHESWQSIIATTGCSRATAFRWIEKFMAEPSPEPEPWTPASSGTPSPGRNVGLHTPGAQTYHWRGLRGATKADGYCITPA